MEIKFNVYNLCVFMLLLYLTGCVSKNNVADDSVSKSNNKSVYKDIPYIQDYSIKYYLSPEQLSLRLKNISADRDGHIRILTDEGVLVPDNGSLFYSGRLLSDISYPSTVSKKISAISTYLSQTLYLDNKYLFSNAWAGKIQVEHGLQGASIMAGGRNFEFLISDGNQLVLKDQYDNTLWSGYAPGVRQISYVEKKEKFLLIFPDKVSELTSSYEINDLYTGMEVTCAAPCRNEEDIVIGTNSGYIFLSDRKLREDLPCPQITAVREINGRLWFGSDIGAFALNHNGRYSYYAGERWLPGNRVISLEAGPGKNVMVLTDRGLGQICFTEMTLEDKAMFYEKQVREKNIRYGFNCSSVRLLNGYSSAQMSAQPSDNLWTAMYLASQLFRYKVTGSREAEQNAFEAFEALERLYTVTNIPGLFARSFERDYKVVNAKKEGWEREELLSGSPAEVWLPAHDHPNWTWRSAASSDQAVGQIFAMTMVLELAQDSAWKSRALKCLDNLMGYIVKNDLYILDVDGKPTLWGKWNPGYVNKFPVNVGDRRLNSSNIIAFLQTAYRFTGKEIYKKKALELMDKYGYLENLTRPVSEIGNSGSDELSSVLSEAWNHSDDEMYFLSYWGLYNYAFTPELQLAYGKAIKDHWEIERPEKNALWNFIYATTGAREFDLDESVEFLKGYPLDLRNWAVKNSHRKDIKLLGQNFRGQTTQELLPLSEVPLYRHNGEIFTLDSHGDGKTLISAGDVWLLPYWMGRYLGIISGPVVSK
jgi:hypothetical protein